MSSARMTSSKTFKLKAKKNKRHNSSTLLQPAPSNGDDFDFIPPSPPPSQSHQQSSLFKMQHHGSSTDSTSAAKKALLEAPFVSSSCINDNSKEAKKKTSLLLKRTSLATVVNATSTPMRNSSQQESTNGTSSIITSSHPTSTKNMIVKKTTRDLEEEFDEQHEENFNIDNSSSCTNDNSRNNSDSGYFGQLRQEHEDLKVQHENLKLKCRALEEAQESMKESIDELKSNVGKKKKKAVTPSKEIRSFVRLAYQQNDKEWSLKKGESPFDNTNRGVTGEIRANVKGLDSSASDEEINSAISTYFTSLRGYKNKLEKNPNGSSYAARYQRKQHKLKRRLKALELKTSITDQKKKKLEKLIVFELQSSEDEADNGNFIVRPLRWRSSRMTNLMDALDQKTSSTQSKRSYRQTAQRHIGALSDRQCPSKIRDDPSFAWALDFETNF